ncbi:hypothetical protein ACWDZ8_06065 [Streptomyces sp. NPDC003233]
MTVSHNGVPTCGHVRTRYVFLAEARKLMASVVLAAFAVAAVVALLVSARGYRLAVSTFQDTTLAAGLDSWPGALVLALRHLGTLSGLLAAVTAGVSVGGGEFENGTWGLLLRQPRTRWLLAVKFATALAAVAVLGAVLALLLRVEGLALAGYYQGHPVRLAVSGPITAGWHPHPASWGQAATTLGGVLLLVMVYVAGGHGRCGGAARCDARRGRRARRSHRL